MIRWPVPGKILNFLQPPGFCLICQLTHPQPDPVCQACFDRLPRLGLACPRCAHPLPEASSTAACGDCLRHPPAFDRVRTAYRFAEPLRHLIHQYKYHEQLILGSVLARMIAVAVGEATEKPDCLIPVPIHPIRLRERGFNQAAYLAELLGKSLSIPVNHRACRKRLNTCPQAGLDKAEREKNLKQAFEVQGLSARKVAIVDDILTTGQTANQLAAQLRAKGVQEIEVWACARAVLEPTG